MPGKRGVAVLLNARLQARVQNFEALSERIACLDFIENGRRVMVIATYLRHSGYSDASVEQVYGQISQLMRIGRHQHRTIILAGDCNARVGQKIEVEDGRVLGNFGFATRNSRGQHFIDWALLHRLAILNTQFQKRPETQWTYTKGGIHLQLDYVLCEWSKRKHCTDAGATERVTVGQDHRGVFATFVFENRQKRKIQRSSSIGPSPRRPPAGEFQTAMQEKLTQLDILHTVACIDSRIMAIETALVETARLVTKSSSEEPQFEADLLDLKERWLELRAARVDARTAHMPSEVARISKEINKVVRAITRRRQKGRIDTILQEFRGLKHIKSIKGNSKKRLMTNMRSSSGKVVTSRVEIANVFADFYEKLYAATDTDASWKICELSMTDAQMFAPFTVQELSKHLRKQ